MGEGHEIRDQYRDRCFSQEVQFTIRTIVEEKRK